MGIETIHVLYMQITNEDGIIALESYYYFLLK